jgi:hypothetical protein
MSLKGPGWLNELEFYNCSLCIYFSVEICFSEQIILVRK